MKIQDVDVDLVSVKQHHIFEGMYGTQLVVVTPATKWLVDRSDYYTITDTGIKALDNMLVYVGKLNPISSDLFEVTLICVDPVPLLNILTKKEEANEQK